MADSIKRLTIEDFAMSFGSSPEEFSDSCRKMIEETDFSYRTLEGKDRDLIILDVIKKIETDQQIIGASDRQGVWEKGWEENLNDFIESDYNLSKLVPRFIRPNRTVRLNQDYIEPVNADFELAYLSLFRRWLFENYLSEYDSVYEFGCGTGFNLVELTRLYPEKTLYGMDFVSSSVNLVNRLGEVYGWPIRGYLFDMISPDIRLELDENSAIFTIGAVEQLASRFDAFLEYLLAASPRLCIHVEPTIELYDEHNLVDYLAMKFHKKRGYTENYLTRLRELEGRGLIDILKVKRLYFGSLYMEGYSCLIWKPR